RHSYTLRDSLHHPPHHSFPTRRSSDLSTRRRTSWLATSLAPVWKPGDGGHWLLPTVRLCQSCRRCAKNLVARLLGGRSTIVAKRPAILRCRMRLRQPVSTGEPPPQRRAILGLQFLWSACHTPMPQFWNHMVNELNVAPRQRRVDNVHAINPRVLPQRKLVDNLLWCASHTGGLSPETREITHRHGAIRVHFAQLMKVAASALGGQIPNRGVQR